MDNTTREKEQQRFIREVLDIDRPGVGDLVTWLAGTSFYEQPASSRFHSNFAGGLVSHSLKVFDAAKALVAGWPYAHPVPDESIRVCALLHDVCKIGAYTVQQRNRKNAAGKWESYDFFAFSKSKNPYGHGEKSVRMISKYIELSDEEALAIRWHMGAWGETNINAVSDAMEHSLTLLIHTADMIASKLLEDVVE